MNKGVEEARLTGSFGHGQQDGQLCRSGRLGTLPPVEDYTISEQGIFTISRVSPHHGSLFSQDDIDHLKTMMPEVLAHYGVTNPNRSFSCPWREDRNPSAAYYPDTNLVYDFGTCETVDVFGLVGKMEEIGGFPDQVRRVAEIAGYDLGASNSARRSGMPVIQRPRFAVPTVAGFGEMLILPYADFMSDLLSNEAALSYLHGRGFSDEKIFQNVLGFVRDPKAVSGAFTLYEPNATLGYVVLPFPVDETFCTVNYAMLRPIPAEAPLAHKEIRPTGVKSPLYREWLVGAGCNVLYVAEGLLDCLALEMLIRKPCLGLGGTSGANRLASLLYYTKPELRPKKVMLALDADEAGRKASDRLLSDIESIGIPCGVLPLPDGCKDPNDMLMMVGGCDG